ncbi:hypothetical protein BH09PLA1_BH09PLA1_32960 [soil metagenome]
MPARSRNILIGTTTIAFCASLLLHAFIVVTAVDLDAARRIFLSGFSRATAIEAKSDRILISLPEPDPDEQLGRADGSGDTMDDSPGELPMQARKGPQNQALLSRDPAGAARMRADLSDSVLSAGSAGAAMTSPPPPDRSAESRAAQQAVEESIEAPEQRAIPFGVGSVDQQPNDVLFDRPATPARAAQPEIIAAAPQAEATVAAADSATPGKPGAPDSPADAAPQSDTESDPFSIVDAVQFRAGGTKARLGRASRLTVPRIGMSGMVDQHQIGRAQLVLEITIDSTGNVRQATILKSSGSQNIDQACRITAYEWWFEPKKGKNGNALKEEKFLFLISFA